MNPLAQNVVRTGLAHGQTSIEFILVTVALMSVLFAPVVQLQGYGFVSLWRWLQLSIEQSRVFYLWIWQNGFVLPGAVL